MALLVSFMQFATRVCIGKSRIGEAPFQQRSQAHCPKMRLFHALHHRRPLPIVIIIFHLVPPHYERNQFMADYVFVLATCIATQRIFMQLTRNHLYIVQHCCSFIYITILPPLISLIILPHLVKLQYIKIKIFGELGIYSCYM